MTKQRAQYILDNRLMGGDFKYSFKGRYGSSNTVYEDGLTEKEVKEITDVWDTMNGNTSFCSAVIRISKEDH